MLICAPELKIVNTYVNLNYLLSSIIYYFVANAIYDALGGVTSMTDELGTTEYAYDANGNLLRVSDEKGSIERKYDALNRIIAYTDYQGKTVNYSYDEIGNLI